MKYDIIGFYVLCCVLAICYTVLRLNGIDIF